MKKLFPLIAMAIMSICLVSCSDDDDSNNVPVAKRVYSSVYTTYSLKFSEATLELGQVVVSYPNSAGEMVRESVLKPVWEKTVKVNKPLSKCEFQVTLTKMPGIDYSESNPVFSTSATGKKYAFMGLEDIEVRMGACDQDGVLITESGFASKSLRFYPQPDQIDEFFDMFSSAPFCHHSVLFDKDGKLVPRDY